MHAWVLLLACAEPTGDSGVPTSEAPEPPTPELDADDVAAGVEALLAGGFIDPNALMDGYLERMSHGDEDCPGDPEQITDTVVYGCETSDGWYYMGVAEYQDTQTPYYGYRELGGDFLIRDPQGDEFEVGAGMSISTEHGKEEVSMIFMGTVVWQGREDWLASASAILEGQLRPYDDQGVLELDGGVRIGSRVLDLEGVTWDPAACGDQASGVVGFRGPDQRWYVADLECGCGPLDFEGQHLGEVCIDLSGLASDVRGSLIP